MADYTRKMDGFWSKMIMEQTVHEVGSKVKKKNDTIAIGCIKTNDRTEYSPVR